MKNLLKKIIPKKWVQLYRSQIKSKSKTREIFTGIYKSNHWNSNESVSGPGSDLSQTRTLIRELQKLLSKYVITSVLDIPCGDFNWMNKVDLSGINYTGADVVVELIEKNVVKFRKRKNIRFKLIDLILDPLPKNDLIICRDCLVHFSYTDIYKSLYNIKASECEYFLTTSFTDRSSNHNILTGEWRPLNLQKPPFNLPEPLLIINEECSENDGIYKDKSMCLWKINQIKLPSALSSIKKTP